MTYPHPVPARGCSFTLFILTLGCLDLAVLIAGILVITGTWGVA